MFELTPLPFAPDALAPLMSADTLNTHHGKHHAAYVKKTNAVLMERGEQPSSLEEVVRRASERQDRALFNQSAQAWNHGFFWQCLEKPTNVHPTGPLASAVEKQFGSLDGFRDQFLKQGESHFASGWIWLAATPDGALSLATMPNAETPIVDRGKHAVFVCDLWEHAYYLDHKNDRPAFLRSFFDNLANWPFAQAQYEAISAGKLGWAYPAPSQQWAKAS